MDYTLTLSQTNSHAYVPICSCGWIGSVHPCPKMAGPKGGKVERNYARGAQFASAEWRLHHKERHIPLAPPDLSLAAQTLTHRGRYGRP